MAKEQLVVVFPTPPLPPTKIHRRLVCSRIGWRVGSRGSRSASTWATDMVMVFVGGLGGL